MKISRWDLVDRFQQHFGEQAAFERARDFVFAYISQVRATLPPLAAQGLEVGRRFREGTATAEERAKVISDMWNYVSERKGWRDTAPEFCIIRAITLLVRDQPGPGERENITELLREVLGMVNKFEDHSDIADGLLRKYFLGED
jgi:hypothetical protein